MEFSDIIYFGYDYLEESKILQKKFIHEIKEKFSDIKIYDAYDSIKGYRQQVVLDRNQKDDYWSWMLAHGWLTCSLGGQLMLMDDKLKDDFYRLLNLARQQYPQLFKS